MSKPKPVFFCVMHGMRGVYMPDEVTHYAARTFKQFAKILNDETSLNEDYKSQSQTRFAWRYIRDARNWREVCTHATRDGSYGLLVSRSTAGDYLTHQREQRKR